MTKPKKTWREKCLMKEEDSADSSDDHDEFKAREGSGTKADDEASAWPTVDVNMVFVISVEFRAPNTKVAELCALVVWVVFEKPVRPGEHMKHLYIKGHLESTPVGQMMVFGGETVNIRPLALFENLGHRDNDLKQTNMSLSGFSGQPTEAKGIMSKEHTVGSNTMLTTFFVVDVRGQYNVLLGRDWIHVNDCVPSTLHQCGTVGRG
jgi:hypothetical protein